MKNKINNYKRYMKMWRLFLFAKRVRIPSSFRLSPEGRSPIRLLEWRKSVTQQQKEQISTLRASGTSFGKIATTLGISVNTVKPYCKRNPITAAKVPTPVQPERIAYCPQCNAILEQSPGHRQKRFCSSKCRTAWWKAHPEQTERKKLFQVECRHCGTVFLQYGSRPRKFCSRGCYLAHRHAQGGDDHD